MTEADPNPFPEIHLTRLRNTADFICNVLHLVADHLRNPTPSEHHFDKPPEPEQQKFGFGSEGEYM